jgi:hypothetical protein
VGLTQFDSSTSSVIYTVKILINMPQEIKFKFGRVDKKEIKKMVIELKLTKKILQFGRTI